MKATRASTVKARKALEPAGRPPDDGAAPPVEAAAEAPVAAEDRDGFIRRTAYAHFEARGRVHGHELDDWLKAEAEFEQLAGGAGDPAASARAH